MLSVCANCTTHPQAPYCACAAWEEQNAAPTSCLKHRDGFAGRALRGAHGQLALDIVEHAALDVGVPQEVLLVVQQALL